MKTNAFLRTGTLLLLTAAGIGCQKEQEAALVSSGFLKYEDGPDPIDTFYNNGDPDGIEGIDFGCWGDPVDCLPSAEIVGNHMAAMDEVFDVVEAGSPTAIREVFAEHEAVLEYYLEDDHIARVLNGTGEASCRISTTPSTRYMVVRNATGQREVLGAYPLE